jgi:glycosyltransferase involved in cell wall biosynthesis
MKISLLIPTYQEEKYIETCLDSILRSDYPFDDVEILIIDGMSTDNTRSIIEEKYMKEYPFIRIIDNPHRTVGYAMNIGLEEAAGELLIRCDAHSEYPADYISQLVEWHGKNCADNIGGICITVPADDTAKGEAIAIAMSHPLGVGLSFRTIKGNKEKYVDTVPFGCWKREVFEKIGNFNVALARGQDFDHNMRMIKHGLKILLLPWLKIKYFARETLRKMYKTFFLIGYWKVKLNKDHKIVTSYRQLGPFAWVLGLIALSVLAIFFPIFRLLFLLYIGLYLLPVLLISFIEGIIKRKKWKVFCYLPLCFILIHFSYGLGSLRGFTRFFILNRQVEEEMKDTPR